MKGYADMGGSVGDLLGAFLGKEGIQQKGFNDYAPKVADMRYKNAAAEDKILEAEQKRRSLGVTADDIITSMGISPEQLTNYRQTGGGAVGADGPQIPMDAMTKDRIQRGDLTHVLNTMGGGNAQQLMQALLGAQQMNAQDMSMTGEYDAGQVGRSAAAAGGKALYSDGASGIMDVFTGGVTPTARSSAATDADVALAEHRRVETEAGGKDPARLKVIERLKGRGIPEDVAYEIGMMDVTPLEMYQKMVSSYLSSFGTPYSSDMGIKNAKKAREMADEDMRTAFGPQWRKVFSGSSSSTAPAPTTPDNDPLGIRS